MGGEKENLELSVNIQTVNISQSNNYIVSHLGPETKIQFKVQFDSNIKLKHQYMRSKCKWPQFNCPLCPFAAAQYQKSER